MTRNVYMVLLSACAFRDSIFIESGTLYIIHMFEHKYGNENWKRVCSQTQLFHLDFLMTVLDNYMFRPLLAIYMLSSRELNVLLYKFS